MNTTAIRGCCYAVLAVSILAIAYRPNEVAAADEVKIVAGPMLTALDRTRVALWIQSNKPAKLYYGLAGCAKGRVDGAVPVFRGEIQTLASRGNTGVAEVRVGDVYQCCVQIFLDEELKLPVGPSSPLLNLPKMPPPPDPRGQFTIAFGSCAHQGRFPKQPIWEAIAKERPDCFLFLGDNIYLPKKEKDFPDTREAVVELYRDLYDKNRQLPELQPLLRSTMVYAIWDDHDFGPNNCDRTWKWKDVALQVFKEYFPGEYGLPMTSAPAEVKGLPDATGVFYRFAWGDVDVFMLDGRSFRDPNKSAERKTMLGDRQLEWLKEGLAASKATFKLVVSGNQVLSDATVYETWGGLFREERDGFLRWLWDRGIEGVIFVSGDVHFGELLKRCDPEKKGPELWEITSSPLANWFMAARLVANPHRVAAYDEGMNFGLIRFDTAAKPATAELMVKDVDGKTVFSQLVSR